MLLSQLPVKILVRCTCRFSDRREASASTFGSKKQMLVQTTMGDVATWLQTQDQRAGKEDPVRLYVSQSLTRGRSGSPIETGVPSPRHVRCLSP